MVIGLCGYGLFSLAKVRCDLMADLQTLEQLLDSGDLPALAEHSELFAEHWHEHERSISRFFRHTPIDEITRVAARLPGFARHGDLANFEAELDLAKALVDHIWNEEAPTFQNVF